jgi:hypothetical protein
MSSDMVAMLATLVPVTPDTSPEKPSQQRKASAKPSTETEDGQVLRRDVEEEAEESTDSTDDDDLDREPRLSPLSVIPQTPDSELQDKRTKKKKKAKAKVIKADTRKLEAKPPLMRVEANTRRDAIEEDSLDLIPETPEERQPRVRANDKKAPAMKKQLDERVEVVAETQMTGRPSIAASAVIPSTATSTMPHFTAVSFGSCASMPVTCAQATAGEHNHSQSSEEEGADEHEDPDETKDVPVAQDPTKQVADAREPGVSDLKKRRRDDNSEEDLSQASLHFSLSLWSPASSMAMPSSQVFAVKHERTGEVVLTPDHHRHRHREAPRRREGGVTSAAAPDQHLSSWSSEFSVPLLSAESPTKDAVSGPGLIHAAVRLPHSSPTARNVRDDGEKLQQEGPSEREGKDEQQQRRQSPPTGEEIEVSEELMVNVETASAAIIMASTIDDEPNKLSEEKNDQERTEEHDKMAEDEEERREREREEQVRLIRERMMEKKRRKEALKMQASADLLPCTPYPASAPLQQNEADDTSPEVLLASIVDDETLGIGAAHEAEDHKEDLEMDDKAGKRDDHESVTAAVHKHDVVPTSDGAKAAQGEEGDIAIAAASPPSIVAADSSHLATPVVVGAGLYRWAPVPVVTQC